MADALDVAVDLCAEFEGFRSAPYRDVVGVPTIGYGTTVYPDGRKVAMTDPPISEAVARGYKRAYLEDARKTILGTLGRVSVTDNQLGAVLSLAYNVGVSAIVGSTLMNLLKRGADRMQVADEFPKWRNAGGKPVAGLLRRRYQEAAVFLRP